MRALNLVLTVVLQLVSALVRSRSDLILENLALRQQLAVFTRTRPRARLEPEDRILWVALRQSWSRWHDALAIVKPETVVAWHRRAFRRNWTSLSRPPGRPKLATEIRKLVVRMAAENPTWGAPRIHGELLKLGFRVSERTVSRYLPGDRPGTSASQEWLTFLRNHREVLTAMDFFTVPTARFRILYVWFVIHHDRPAQDSALQCDGASHRSVGHPAAPGVVPVRHGPRIPGARPRLDLREERHLDGTRPQHRAEAHCLSQSLAEWRGGALDRQLPPGAPGSGDRAPRGPSSATSP